MKKLFISVSALTPLTKFLPLIRNWNKKRYLEDFKRFKDTDRNHYRIFLPFKADHTKIDKDVEIPFQILEALRKEGYEVHDYFLGLAKKIGSDGKKNLKSIGKILHLGSMAKHYYDSDEFRKGARVYNRELEIVISRHPYDIAGMSTGRGWLSCQTLIETPTHKVDPVLTQYVKTDIAAGSIIAYLIYKDSDEDLRSKSSLQRQRNLVSPIARVKIFRYENRGKGYVFYPALAVHGQDIGGFREAVIHWCQQANAFNKHRGKFKIDNERVYVDEEDSLEYVRLDRVSTALDYRFKSNDDRYSAHIDVDPKIYLKYFKKLNDIHSFSMTYLDHHIIEACIYHPIDKREETITEMLKWLTRCNYADVGFLLNGTPETEKLVLRILQEYPTYFHNKHILSKLNQYQRLRLMEYQHDPVLNLLIFQIGDLNREMLLLCLPEIDILQYSKKFLLFPEHFKAATTLEAQCALAQEFTSLALTRQNHPTACISFLINLAEKGKLQVRQAIATALAASLSFNAPTLHSILTTYLQDLR